MLGSFTVHSYHRILKALYFLITEFEVTAFLIQVQTTGKKILIYKNANCVNFSIHVRIQILVFES